MAGIALILIGSAAIVAILWCLVGFIRASRDAPMLVGWLVRLHEVDAGRLERKATTALVKSELEPELEESYSGFRITRIGSSTYKFRMALALVKKRTVQHGQH
jgi:hypothetical protein